MNQCICMTWQRTWVETQTPPLTRLQHMLTVRHLTCKVEGLGHKIFMDNFFSSPRLLGDVDRRKIDSCETVQPNRGDMPCDFRPEQPNLKRGNVRVMTRGGLTALVWKDRREVYMLSNVDPRKFVWQQQQPCENSHCGMVQLAHRLCWHFWSYG